MNQAETVRHIANRLLISAYEYSAVLAGLEVLVDQAESVESNESGEGLWQELQYRAAEALFALAWDFQVALDDEDQLPHAVVVLASRLANSLTIVTLASEVDELGEAPLLTPEDLAGEDVVEWLRNEAADDVKTMLLELSEATTASETGS